MIPARQIELQQIADAIAAGKLRKMPNAAELAAIDKGVQHFNAVPEAIGWLVSEGHEVRRVSRYTYRIDGGRTIANSQLCEYANNRVREAALAKAMRRR